MSVLKLGIPVGAAAFRSQIQHQPERIKIGRAARILSRVRHRAAHLSAVEVPDDTITASEDAESGNIRVVRVDV